MFYILPAENYLYITGSDNIWKTDQQLNILIPFDYSNADFSGLYYNSTNSLIYVASHNLGDIYVFNLDLALTDMISTSNSYPWSINGYNNQLFVGTDSGTILVIVNNLIIQQFNGCNEENTHLISMIFDEYDNMATGCNNNYLYLYSKNGSFLNKNIPTVSDQAYLGFDLKSRLVVVTRTEISLYN